MNVLTRDAADEIKEHEKAIIGVVGASGGCSSQYQRERVKTIRATVSEMYSPPRVKAATKFLPELKIIPGFAFDLTTADTDGRLWDFDEAEMRDRARKRIAEEKPMLLVGRLCVRLFRIAEDQQPDPQPGHCRGGAQESKAAPRVLRRAIQRAGEGGSLLRA